MKNLKRGEIVIYVIALMLVTAGYFNYIEFSNNTQETYSEGLEEEKNEEYSNIGDAVLVNSNIEETENNEEKNVLENREEDVKETTNDEVKKENEYFASSKLERDKMYAEMITNYQNILNNDKVSEVQKSIATEEIKKINNTKNAIMICENLILTKGFSNCVIFINEDSVNVVLQTENGLKQEDVAKIQNIISREIETTIENIHISEN